LPTSRLSGTIQDMPIERVVLLALLLSADELIAVHIIFRFIPERWSKNRFAAAAFLFLFLVPFNAGLVILLTSGWLATPANATTVQVVAAAGQLVFAIILVGLTFRTVQANADMARETGRMATVAVEQQRAAIKPVLVFRLWSDSDDGRRPVVDAFRIEVMNVGAGPALETVVRVNGPPLRYGVKSFPLQPIVVTLADPIAFEFVLNKDVPFVDENDSLRWTPDEELERQIAAHESLMRVAKADLDEHDRIKTAQRQHRHDFDCAVADRVAGLPSVGYVQADYVDLAGTPYRSTVPLLVQERDEKSPLTPNWSPLTLGQLSVQPPLTANIASGAR
jgi:uncharacterized membrane protein (DUF485 family)